MKRSDGRVALVTGGASGIGKAIAERLAQEGARVVITDVQTGEGRTTAAEEGFLFLSQDVRDEARWIEVIQEVERRCGQLNILINNAGIIGPMGVASPENARLADWQDVFAVNVAGVFLGCRAAIPAMRRAGGGSIINVGSVAGLMATPHATAYGASKAAVRQLTQSVAKYCAQEKLSIRCNTLHPGDVRTPLWDKQAQEAAEARGISVDEIIARGRALVPLGDFTLPQDIAAAAAFLASNDSRHMTGAELIVDGGFLRCHE